jgi:hypothetical protein
MIRTLTIAITFAIATSTAACTDMGTSRSGDATGATGSAGASGYATDRSAVMHDPVGSANSGTGSVKVGTEGQREAVSSGEGLD